MSYANLSQDILIVTVAAEIFKKDVLKWKILSFLKLIFPFSNTLWKNSVIATNFDAFFADATKIFVIPIVSNNSNNGFW